MKHLVVFLIATVVALCFFAGCATAPPVTPDAVQGVWAGQLCFYGRAIAPPVHLTLTVRGKEVTYNVPPYEVAPGSGYDGSKTAQVGTAAYSVRDGKLLFPAATGGAPAEFWLTSSETMEGHRQDWPPGRLWRLKKQ